MIKKKPNIIVSLTSYPKRINTVDQVIKTILEQTKKADRIILWLSEEEFSNKERDLPKSLLELKDAGLEISWCIDLKPHKKYYFTMLNWPDDIIITVDDDMMYSPNMIEELYKSYLKHPNAISAGCTHLMTFTKGNKIRSYKNWIKRITAISDIPRMDLMAVGFAGVLYPPHCMDINVFNIEKIKKFCLYEDDLWLKFNEIIYNVPTVCVTTYETDTNLPGTIEDSLYSNYNSQGGNDQAIQYLWDYFLTNGRIHNYKINYEEQLFKLSDILDTGLFELRKSRSLILFGAGSITYKFIHSTLPYLTDMNIKCIIVSSQIEEEYSIYGIKVNNIDIANLDINNDSILITTKRCFWEEISELLIKRGFSKFSFMDENLIKICEYLILIDS